MKNDELNKDKCWCICAILIIGSTWITSIVIESIKLWIKYIGDF